MITVELNDLTGSTAWKVASRPEPGPLLPNQIDVALKAASLNYRDLLVARGLYNPNIQLPAVPVSDGAGEVVGVGSSVTRFKVGDRVAPTFFQDWYDGQVLPRYHQNTLGAGGSGILTQRLVISEEGAVRIPDSLSYEQAATLPCAALTAWSALFENASLRSGMTVLVQGTGGVSIFALQFAKAAGARVVATTRSESKREKLLQLGADVVINSTQEANWGEAVVAQTGGHGADIVIDLGGPDTVQHSLAAAAPGATVALIGVLSGFEAPLPLFPVLTKQVRLQGIFVGSRRMFEDMNRAIDSIKLEPVIDRVFSLEQSGDALRHLESGSHFGKVVISFA